MAANLPRVRRELRREMAADWKALLGIADGRAEDGRERERAKILDDAREPSNLSRDGNGESAAERQRRIHLALPDEHFGPGLCRCRLAKVDEMIAVRLGVVNQREAASTDATRGRIQDAGGEDGGDCGVHRVTAPFEHLCPGPGGELVLGGDHSLRCGRGRQGRRREGNDQNERSQTG